jgi:hypothetical protein
MTWSGREKLDVRVLWRRSGLDEKQTVLSESEAMTASRQTSLYCLVGVTASEISEYCHAPVPDVIT